MDERLVQQWLGVLVLTRGGGVPLALTSLVADEPPAATVDDVVQRLDVDVDQRAGMVMLVTAHWLPGCALDVGWTLQPGRGHDPVDRRRRDAGPGGELDRPLPRAAAAAAAR